MESLNKIHYSELPSRNIYIDNVVNNLPGYYPARSEFICEYNNNAEEQLSSICYLYDQIINGEDYNDEDEENEQDEEDNQNDYQDDDDDDSRKNERNIINDTINTIKKEYSSNEEVEEELDTIEETSRRLSIRKRKHIQNKDYIKNKIIKIDKNNQKEQEKKEINKLKEPTSIPLVTSLQSTTRERKNKQIHDDYIKNKIIKIENISDKEEEEIEERSKEKEINKNPKVIKYKTIKNKESKNEKLNKNLDEIINIDNIKLDEQINKQCEINQQELNKTINKYKKDVKIENVDDDNNVDKNTKQIHNKNQLIKKNINKINKKDREVLEQLCIACISIYNNQIIERNNIKKLIKNHGILFDQNKFYSWYNINKLELNNNNIFNILFPKYLKCFKNSIEFDLFLTNLKLENELKIKINNLINLRLNGIKYKKLIPIYNNLNNIKNKYKNQLINYNYNINDIINQIKNENNLLASQQYSFGTNKNKVMKKLNIIHLPKYKYLNDEEKDICETIRLTPESFLSFKQIMIDECKKLGNLKLAQARNLFKIDVNKTRKLYNYLIEKKSIWKPEE